MLYSCTYMTTVGVKGLNLLWNRYLTCLSLSLVQVWLWLCVARSIPVGSCWLSLAASVTSARDLDNDLRRSSKTSTDSTSDSGRPPGRPADTFHRYCSTRDTRPGPSNWSSWWCSVVNCCIIFNVRSHSGRVVFQSLTNMLQMFAVVTEMKSISHHPRQRDDVSVHRNSVYWPEWHADGLVDFTQQWLAFYIHTYILTFTTELNMCPMLSHVSCTGPMCYTHFLMFAWAVLVSTMTVADTQVSVCKSSFEHISLYC